jgi:hypothetical protein
MRWIGWCLVALAVPAIAGAAPMRMYPGETPTLGGGGHLPLGPYVSRDDVIRAAYALPEVQAALTHMASRGYVAHPAYDEAGLAPGVATFVALAFEKPGLIPPGPNVLGAPMIVVGTVKDASGELQTRVAGGLAFVDTTSNLFWTADSLPAQFPEDQSWEVVPAGGGDDDGGGLERVSPRGSRYIGPFAFTFGGTNSSEDQRFRRFMHCAALGAGSAAMNALWQGPPIPQKVVIQAGVMAVISVIGCGVGAYGGVAP